MLENENTIVSYKDILGVPTDLCRTVSEEQTLCKSVYVSIQEWIAKLRAGDKFEVNFHNIGLPHHVVADGRSKPHAAVVTPTVVKRKGYKRLMSGQECLRLQYGKKYKRMSANTYNCQEIRPVIDSRKKSALDDEYFVTGGKKKNVLLVMP